jgi:hypothetical protein
MARNDVVNSDGSLNIDRLGQNVDDIRNITSDLADIESHRIKGNTNQKYRLVAGVIRNDGTGWAYIEDTGHAKTGLYTISTTTNNEIKIDYDFTATKVSSLVVTPDETFTKYGIVCGSSVGTTYSLIKPSMPFSCYVTGTNTISAIPAPLSNSTTITSGTSGFTINHSAALSNDIPVVAVLTESAQVPSLDVRLSYSATSVICTAYADFHGYIAFDGTNWTVTTSNINKPTLSFDSTTGILTVTHEKINNSLSVGITGRGVNLPALGSVGSTSFEVKFYDYAGSVITTPNTDMKLFYHRGVKVKNTMPSDMRVSIRRGNVYIPVNDLVDSSGNFWIYGIMEV